MENKIEKRKHKRGNPNKLDESEKKMEEGGPGLIGFPAMSTRTLHVLAGEGNVMKCDRSPHTPPLIILFLPTQFSLFY